MFQHKYAFYPTRVQRTDEDTLDGFYLANMSQRVKRIAVNKLRLNIWWFDAIYAPLNTYQEAAVCHTGMTAMYGCDVL